jgi:uncharacterized protein
MNRHARLASRIALAALAWIGMHGGTAAGQAVQQDAFVITLGADTFAVENFSRTTARLDGAITSRATGRLVYGAALDANGVVQEMTLRAWMPGVPGDDAPMQEVRITLSGDSVLVEVTGAAGSRTERLATTPGAVLYVNPSFALMDQVLLRARAMGGTTAQVPVFMVQGGQTLNATVTWEGADSAVIVMGAEMRAAVGADGRILHATVAAQQLSAIRVEGAHVQPLAVEPPDYSAPDDAPYTAEHVVVTTPAGHTLAGTLTRPQGDKPVPAVVMITGSGSQDRDQALPMVPGYRPFRQVADTLSRRGIAVLRLDDRGFGESTGNAAAATSAGFADDIRAAVDYLRARPDIDGARVGLVGHSEGGMIAPMLAATDTALAAIVLIAGPAHTGRHVIEYQQRFAIEQSETIPPASRDSAFAEAQRQLEDLMARQPWLRFFVEYDPLPTARQVRHTPVLVMHGETDRQVTLDQAHLLAEAFREAGNRDVTVTTFPDVNHLLLRDPDGSPAGYVTLRDRAVVPEVLGTLAEWLAARLLH